MNPLKLLNLLFLPALTKSEEVCQSVCANVPGCPFSYCKEENGVCQGLGYEKITGYVCSLESDNCEGTVTCQEAERIVKKRCCEPEAQSCFPLPDDCKVVCESSQGMCNGFPKIAIPTQRPYRLPNEPCVGSEERVVSILNPKKDLQEVEYNDKKKQGDNLVMEAQVVIEEKAKVVDFDKITQDVEEKIEEIEKKHVQNKETEGESEEESKHKKEETTTKEKIEAGKHVSKQAEKVAAKIISNTSEPYIRGNGNSVQFIKGGSDHKYDGNHSTEIVKGTVVEGDHHKVNFNNHDQVYESVKFGDISINNVKDDLSFKPERTKEVEIEVGSISKSNDKVKENTKIRDGNERIRSGNKIVKDSSYDASHADYDVNMEGAYVFNEQGILDLKGNNAPKTYKGEHSGNFNESETGKIQVGGIGDQNTTNNDDVSVTNDGISSADFKDSSSSDFAVESDISGNNVVDRIHVEQNAQEDVKYIDENTGIEDVGNFDQQGIVVNTEGKEVVNLDVEVDLDNVNEETVEDNKKSFVDSGNLGSESSNTANESFNVEGSNASGLSLSVSAGAQAGTTP